MTSRGAGVVGDRVMPRLLDNHLAFVFALAFAFAFAFAFASTYWRSTHDEICAQGKLEASSRDRQAKDEQTNESDTTGQPDQAKL